METSKKKRKIGWFGWSLVTIFSVALIASLLLFFNVFKINSVFSIEDLENAQNEKATEGQEVDADTAKEIEEIQETVGAQHVEIGDFIVKTHDFYNDKTGYGNINNLNWKEQTDKAKEIIGTIEKEIETVQSDALKTDLKAIVEIAKATISDEKVEQVRHLHRYFHDLDIALNHYNGSDKIWRVTETLK